MKYTGLTVEQELEMDQKLFGEAYYQIVDGVKERIDPETLVKLTPNKSSMVPDQYLGGEKRYTKIKVISDEGMGNGALPFDFWTNPRYQK